MRLALFAVLVVSAVVSGCTCQKTCTPQSCAGCCDSTNTCQLGLSTAACGANANTCMACTAFQTCNAGTCATSSVGGGGGGGATGGGATGGGAATGGGGATGGGAATGGGGGGGTVFTPDGGIELDRTALQFEQEFGSSVWLGASPQQTVLVRNGTGQPVTLMPPTISGADATAFTGLIAGGAVMIANGETGAVRVVFTPTMPRAYSATLTVNTSAMNFSVVLSGLAAAPRMAGGGASNPECLSGTDCSSPPSTASALMLPPEWKLYSEDGRSLLYTDDADGDGRPDALDNCPFASNRDQLDADGDGDGDGCDNCGAASNFTQLDADLDGMGDTCDADLDGDGITNALDNCASAPNPAQVNHDTDTLGDACDNDDDDDGVLDTNDICPWVANMMSPGPSCTADGDGDNISDAFDNCPAMTNPTQLDTDLDGLGDACDLDLDNDGIGNVADNCALVRNRDQRDDDGDGLGDGCDARACFVIDPSNPSDCLDPFAPFQVNAGGIIIVNRGVRLPLPLFANRNGAGIRYTWSVMTRPNGSTAAITNATGTAGLSRHWQYAYLDGQVPSLTPDVQGNYVLQLSATLAVPDRTFPAQSTATAQLTVQVGP